MESEQCKQKLERMRMTSLSNQQEHSPTDEENTLFNHCVHECLVGMLRFIQLVGSAQLSGERLSHVVENVCLSSGYTRTEELLSQFQFQLRMAI
ncbi:hypothetical protein DPEC_G00342480 [Dallia pectoralis]|uniref:Uncharacterized protein n=1 Tax=Dallia pectoralis TaxID=75939 RepID=A0ACC2F5V5_DALPE|nr:hypothetical protein DPEC_G00342480 [Dallia pectoralis]